MGDKAAYACQQCELIICKKPIYFKQPVAYFFCYKELYFSNLRNFLKGYEAKKTAKPLFSLEYKLIGEMRNVL